MGGLGIMTGAEARPGRAAEGRRRPAARAATRRGRAGVALTRATGRAFAPVPFSIGATAIARGRLLSRADGRVARRRIVAAPARVRVGGRGGVGPAFDRFDPIAGPGPGQYVPARRDSESENTASMGRV